MEKLYRGNSECKNTVHSLGRVGGADYCTSNWQVGNGESLAFDRRPEDTQADPHERKTLPHQTGELPLATWLAGRQQRDRHSTERVHEAAHAL